MAKQILDRKTVIIVSVICLAQASALTDHLDVLGLDCLFISLNKNPQLKGWRLGGDPCQELWTGVSCAGPSLIYLNLSHNLLSGTMRDLFTAQNNLKETDLSYNEFTGELPPSFETLKNISRLFLQNNQFTGSVVYLSELPLIDLNIQSNHFSGVIPTQFQSIPNLWIDGNNFQAAVNYPPWSFPLHSVSTTKNFTVPPASESSATWKYLKPKPVMKKKKKLGPGGIDCAAGGITLAVTFAAILIVMRVKRIHKFPSARTRGENPECELLIMLSK